MKKIIFFTGMVLNLFYATAQNVGIGTSTPIARLHVADSNVLFTGPVSIPGTTTYHPPASGAGSRMMWYPQKAAFRVGAVDGTEWDKDNIGRYSFSSGFNTNASGNVSTSMGVSTIASGSYSTSMGNNTNASGNVSTSMGASTIASGLVSTSMGSVTTASGVASTSMGNITIANGYTSTSMGYFTTANGDYSTSMGFYTNAKSNNSLVIGKYNDTTATNSLFEIGNGTGVSSRSNALTVLTNGNVGIGTTVPNAILQLSNTIANRKIVLYDDNNNDNQYYGFGINGGTLRYQVDAVAAGHTFYAGTGAGTSQYVFAIHGNGNIFAPGIFTSTSDARLKKNITPLSSTLTKLTQLNGYTYNWLSPTRDQRQQIGLLAQEVQKVYPQLVTELKGDNNKTTLGINYLGLIPVLLEGMKEQQKQIEQQQKQIDEQRKMIEQLLKK
jgi:Chaperone of endosialidase